MKIIRVLFVGPKFDYGFPQQGYSFEYVNFFDSLLHMKNVDVTFFPIDVVMREQGRESMNRQLLATIADVKPDVCFFLLFTDEIKKETLQILKERGDTITLNWFADDHWRFEEFSQFWSPFFHWVVTTDKDAVEKYHRIGYHNVIQSQWAANHFLYKYFKLPIDYDVTFIGQVHSNREYYIKEVKRSGTKVDCWGNGWSNGRLSQNEMISFFSKSKINLNFSDSSIVFNKKQLAKIFLNRRADDTFRLKTPKEMYAHVKTLACHRHAQIKGRNFEIPAAGGFLLTQYVAGIEEYYTPGKEIVTFASIAELCEKVHYYLAHESERESIRQAGYERTIREHTFQQRFDDLFKIILNQ